MVETVRGAGYRITAQSAAATPVAKADERLNGAVQASPSA
jgi:DNA-binding winged helix-turn-helix (wHTH) protein